MKISLKRLNNAVHFQAKNEDGNTIDIDGSPAIGGEDLGVRPMQLLLMGLASCSSMDMISILTKQKQIINDYDVEVEAERDTESTPSLFTDIMVTFIVNGEVDTKKAIRATKLSMNKYCSVSKIMEKTATISYKLLLNNEPINLD